MVANKTSLKNILIFVALILTSLLVAGTVIPVRTSSTISKCGNGITRTYRDSMVFQFISVSEWEQDRRTEQLLESGIPLCESEQIDTPVISRLYVL